MSSSALAPSAPTPSLRTTRAETAEAILERGGALCRGGARAAQPKRRSRRGALDAGWRRDAAGLRRGLSAVRRGRLAAARRGCADTAVSRCRRRSAPRCARSGARRISPSSCARCSRRARSTRLPTAARPRRRSSFCQRWCAANGPAPWCSPSRRPDPTSR